MKLSSPDGETLDFWSDSLLPKNQNLLDYHYQVEQIVLYYLLCCVIILKQPEGYIRYNPFKQVTKMFIKHLYNHFNLLDTLFPITTSCTRLYIKENITTPCKQCFWYQEKYWAFGCYDWEVPQKTPQGYIKWER
jgi:hypothetical protein